MLQRLRLVAFAVAIAFPAFAPAFAQAPAVTPAPGAIKPAIPGIARPVPPTAPAIAAPAPVVAAKPAMSTPTMGTTGRVDINSATLDQLDTLNGVGEGRAKKIVAGRPYTSLDDLTTRKILTKSVLDGAKSRMALANINTSSAADLARTLPGIGDVRAAKIVATRPYAAPGDLVTKGVLTQPQFDAITGLVSF